MPRQNGHGFLVAVSTAAAFFLMAASGSAVAAPRNGDTGQQSAATDLSTTVSPNGGAEHAAPRFEGSCRKVSPAVRATHRTAARECITVRTSKAAKGDKTTDVGATGFTAEDPEDYDPGVDDPFPDEPSSEACSLVKFEYRWTRTGGQCGSVEVQYILYDEYGKVLGTGLLDVSTTLHTKWNSTELSEDIRVAVTQVTDAVKTLNVKFRTDCTAGCLATQRAPWYGNTALGVGSAPATGTVSYSGVIPAGGTRTSFQTQYQMYVTTAGSIPVDPSASWMPPAGAIIRCDSEMPTTSGCVMPSDDDEKAPTLVYNLSDPKHGQAAAAYELGMRLRGSNLFHGANKDVADTNRKKTCGSLSSKKFVNLYPDIPKADSCDEFPFASTQEGGTDGALCAEITPTLVNGVWTTPPTDPSNPVTNQQCIRAHMSLSANSSAGGRFGSFKGRNRIISGDAFRMVIEP